MKPQTESGIEISKGMKVFFIGEKLPMEVKAVNENFAICTRDLHRRHDADMLHRRVEMKGYNSFTEAYDDLKDEVVYTIIDLKKNIRAPHNSWGYGIEKATIEEDVLEILKALESNEIELSRRNQATYNLDFERTLNQK